MTSTPPSILIVARDARQRKRIAFLLKESGMRPVVAAKNAVALLGQSAIAGAVVALPDRAAREFLSQAAINAPLAKIVVVGNVHPVPTDDERVVRVPRPLDARELIGGILDLILREDASKPPARHGMTAELSIAAAKLKCLCMREASAAATGAGRLMDDLSAQIADMSMGGVAPTLTEGAD